jgi:hypothetical protein
MSCPVSQSPRASSPATASLVRPLAPSVPQLTPPAIALYRALLTQTTRLPLPAPSRAALANAIRARFRALRAQRLRLALAFHAGYAGLALVDASVAGCSASTARVADLLSRTPDALKQPPPRPVPKADRARLLRRRGTRGPAVAPDEHPPPPAHKFFAVFPRPTPPRRAGPDGCLLPRRVPRLVNANKIPFVRYKRRQPANVSRMITHLQRRERRVHALQERLWDEDLPVAVAEDEWGRLVARARGRAGLGREEGEERGFKEDVVEMANRADQVVRDLYNGRQEMIDRMQTVVDWEAQLANRERRERRARRRAERDRLRDESASAGPGDGDGNVGR